MSDQDARINFLAKKWKTGKITEEELREFETWYHSIDDSRRMVDHVASEEELKHRIFSKIATGLPTTSKRHIRSSKTYFRIGIAASIIVLLSLTGILFYHSGRNIALEQVQSLVENESLQHDVMPGTDKAVLVLGDGSRVVLEDGKKVISSEKTGRKIVSHNGRILFGPEKLPEGPLPKTVYNTVVTPSSGQYQVVLPDGSHVWLNAESSLKFPDHFTENKRQVELSGEGYFEVAQDLSRPFEVLIAGQKQKIEVLGTHFNINAYPNEQEVRTSLLEGKVRLVAGSNSILMHPGQESIVSRAPKKSNNIILYETNIQQAIAWKNGLFDFKDADIGMIMRVIARWYDVETEYSEKSSTKKFSGKIYRNVSLQEVLKILNYSGISAVLEHPENSQKKGKIMVYPQI